jgi:hypothetical protein
LFDVFWRLPKKAHEDADVFVLGAVSELDARRFGSALLIVTDATVAAPRGRDGRRRGARRTGTTRGRLRAQN